MKKICLEEAKKVLKEQGYEIVTSLSEALLERYSLFEDIEYRIQELVENKKIASEKVDSLKKVILKNKTNIEYDFADYFNDNEIINEVYWIIIDNLIEKYI